MRWVMLGDDARDAMDLGRGPSISGFPTRSPRQSPPAHSTEVSYETRSLPGARRGRLVSRFIGHARPSRERRGAGLRGRERRGPARLRLRPRLQVRARGSRRLHAGPEGLSRRHVRLPLRGEPVRGRDHVQRASPLRRPRGGLRHRHPERAAIVIRPYLGLGFESVSVSNSGSVVVNGVAVAGAGARARAASRSGRGSRASTPSRPASRPASTRASSW